MESFFDVVLIAFALIFVIEGLLYSLFPDAMKRVLAMALIMPAATLRRFGMLMVLCGFGLITLLKTFGL